MTTAGRSEVWSVRDVGFEAKVAHIGPKWDKSRACSDQISVYFQFLLGEPKKYPEYPILGQSDPL